MIADLARILVFGLAAGGFALLFRALPWPKSWVGSVWTKIMECPACAGGRGALAVMLLLPEWPGWRGGAILFLGASAVGALVYAKVRPPDLGLGGLG